jgi:HlyD family secretion protein
MAASVHSMVPAMAIGQSVASPRGELRFGAAVIGIFLVLGVGWAGMAPLNSAVVAPGTVKVSGERQKVQTLREGVISALHVSEGSTVQAGQVLVEFASSESRASERALATRVIGLYAEIARLQAEQAGAKTFAVPPVLADLPAPDRDIAARALQLERQQLAAQLSARSTENAVLKQRVAQIDDQMNGSALRRRSTQQQRALMASQIEDVRALAAEGYASRNRLLDLERSAAELDGTIGSLGAESARLRNSEGEARLQTALSHSAEMKATADRLREAQAEVQSLLPQWATAREQLARTEIRAPAAGVVVGLAAHTVGGVAPAGQTLMEIVPFDRSLTIEAQIKATDVNQLHPGQLARLKVTAVHGRSVPQLQGKVTQVSADSFADERTGQSYYKASIAVSESELQRLVSAEGQAGRLRPGNLVQVMVTLHPRSALEYWLDPLVQALGSSLHEQ